MLGYNECEILEHFKHTLPTRYHYLLCGIQNLREEVESAKCVMNKEKIGKTASRSKHNPINVI